MIQRIQSILLLGVSICMGMVLAFYIWSEVNPETSTGILFSPMEMKVIDMGEMPQDSSDDVITQTESTWYLAALAVAASLVSLFSIFQFKNRLNQMKLGALNSLLMVSYLGVCFFKVNQFEEIVMPQVQGGFHLGFMLPAGALILNAIANRFIRKDEKLVKSVDRIR
ncbi:DUF4293 domain-containing protein [uncultured Roseivirga sp.]|uniref:DUF4293 domain-containing protein n=1 Tax=uncultured Roseivirga sp. TaxID=543088 RepID=UPI0030D770A8|tara:strand:+ start:65584 stop:66084 length:501 start_codon:yes stop_codon:yes gene_type:complete